MELDILMRGDLETRDNLESRVSHTSEESEILDFISTISVDVFETSDALVVIAPVAGTDLNNLEVLIADGEILEIKGKSSLHEFVAESEYHLKECHFGDFSRSILLPPGLDTSKVRATYKKGILRVEIKKSIVVPEAHSDSLHIESEAF
jgi:HSP20 family molecular chaperone IbpA